MIFFSSLYFDKERLVFHSCQMAGAGGKSQGAGTGSLALNASFCSALSVCEFFCTLKTSLLYSSLIKCNGSVASDIRVRNAASTYIRVFRGSLST